jgi:conjugal transfer mating pair stabilization protein TraN
VDEWPLIGCVQTAQTHCIFESKLGRIIQEQGRMQLKAFQDANGNPYWGTPENPNCRGFTPEEFQSLDFSKMDLSEYFADINTKANAAIQQDMRNNVQNYYNNLP